MSTNATNNADQTRSKSAADIISRINKLMAKANDARGFEAEASAAADMASKLMEQYNISSADMIEAEMRGDSSSLLRVNMAGTGWDVGVRIPQVFSMFSVSCAKLFDCEVVSELFDGNESKKTIMIYGYKPDVEMATWLFRMVIARGTKAATTHVGDMQALKFQQAAERAQARGKRPRFMNIKPEELKRMVDDFLFGVTITVGNRIQDRIRERDAIRANAEADARARGEGCTALAVVKQDLIRQHFGKSFTYGNGRASYRHSDSYQAGCRKGNEIDIGARPIGGSSSSSGTLRLGR